MFNTNRCKTIEQISGCVFKTKKNIVIIKKKNTQIEYNKKGKNDKTTKIL